MDYTFYMLPLSIIQKAERGSDENGTFLLFNERKIYRLHLVGSIAAIEINHETGSGYLILDDTFYTILVHFQQPIFKYVEDMKKGDLVEMLGSIDIYNDSVTMSLTVIKSITLERYCFNKLESLRILREVST
ncbi:hypothetical protein M1293_02200 [Candidatus Parvarchaeota archaeon]|nr:hypothetical protein [Candidatus Parvarchaeota archaeon]